MLACIGNLISARYYLCHFAAFPSKIVLRFSQKSCWFYRVARRAVIFLVFALYENKNARYIIFAHVQIQKYLARVGLLNVAERFS